MAEAIGRAPRLIRSRRVVWFHRPLIVLALLSFLFSSVASARQPEPEPAPGEARVAIAPWVSLGAAYRHDTAQTDAAVDFAFDLALTWSVLDTHSATQYDSRMRLGPWFQVRTGSFQSLDLTLGARMFLGGSEVRWFKARGRWGFHVDLGAAHSWRRPSARAWAPRQYSAVARLAWGYRTVWPSNELDEYSDWDRSERVRPGVAIERGLRVVATLRRSIEGPTLWEASLGLETELSGVGVWLASLF